MERVSAVMRAPAFRRALTFLESDRDVTLAQQLELAQIPSHSNHEEKKAKCFAEMLREIGVGEVTADSINNVYTVVKGSRGWPKILVVGHSDTVFPMDTPLIVTHGEDGKIYCPGICDDTRAMAEILSMLRAIKKESLKPVGDIIIGSDVGEEAQGKMRGVRHLCETLKDIDGFISIDLPGAGTAVHQGTGSNRIKVTFKGFGGHSFTAFGTPNPVNAAGRAIAAIAELRVPSVPKTTFNVGLIAGGTAVTAIPQEASICFDLRSNGKNELEELTQKVMDIVAGAVEEENKRFVSSHKVTYETEMLGVLPVASQPADIPIFQTVLEALKQLGIEHKPRPEGAAPTDSNWAITYGIPAVTLGRGGESGSGHSLTEWFLPKDEFKGPQKNLLSIFSLVGLDGISEPILEKR